MSNVKGQRIYIASSWRNVGYPGIVHILKRAGADVYDFRNPIPGNQGFHWSSVEPRYTGGSVSAKMWRKMLAHPLAEQGYKFDITALKECTVCVLVLPAGRSACFEFGYAMAMGKRCIVVAFDDEVPDLMFREAKICGDIGEFLDEIDFPNL